MTPVRIIAEKIAPFIQLSYPNDEETIFSYLSLVQNKIWRAGLFHNSTQYHYCNVDSDGNIITPHGYNVLLGCNINFRPVTLTSYSSLFHKNGNGEASIKDKNLYQEVIFLGESPVMFQPNDSWIKGERELFVTVKGSSCEERKFTDVSCLDCNGKPIYSYYTTNKRGKEILKTCSFDKKEELAIDVRNGIRYAITSKPQYHNKILITQISAIFKDQTIGPVEYYLNDPETGVGRLCARLEPFETVSKYKRYKVASRCIQRGQVYALFKMSEPIDIVSDSQIFLSSNIEAITSIAKGFKLKNENDKLQEGEMFINDGLKALREELAGNRTKKREPLQIDSFRDFSKIKKIV